MLSVAFDVLCASLRPWRVLLPGLVGPLKVLFYHRSSIAIPRPTALVAHSEAIFLAGSLAGIHPAIPYSCHFRPICRFFYTSARACNHQFRETCTSRQINTQRNRKVKTVTLLNNLFVHCKTHIADGQWRPWDGVATTKTSQIVHGELLALLELSEVHSYILQYANENQVQLSFWTSSPRCSPLFAEGHRKRST